MSRSLHRLPDPAQPLDREAAAEAFDAIITGDVADSDIAAFLVALAERGETADELAAAASVLRRLMLPIAAPEGVIDLCGTGSDGAHSLNISTSTTFVVAACGVPVAKHGNRSASSRSGAADVLEALGWKSDLPLDRVEACLFETGMTFVFAQSHHPALARVAPVRRALGRRTIFNLVGPLANPAGVLRQMIGVPLPRWMEPMALAAASLGAEEVLTVHGGGLDEVAVHGSSALCRIREGRMQHEHFDPVSAGIGLFDREDIDGGEPAENAAELLALMQGRGRPAYRAITLANAAMALTVTGRSFPDALALAEQALDSGAAAECLARFVAFR